MPQIPPTASGPPSRIIVLAGAEDALFLLNILSFHVPKVAVLHATSVAEIREYVGSGPAARLIAYATSVIVPPDVLSRLDGPGYNFHPGPPDYPGTEPSALAVYDGVRRFGVTAHEMTTRVDDGPIVGTLSFEIPEGIDAAWLRLRAAHGLAKLFVHMAPLLTHAAPLPRQAVTWGPRRSTAKSIQAMRLISEGTDAAELDRRRRAFHTSERPLVLVCHGHRFVLDGEGRPGGYGKSP